MDNPYRRSLAPHARIDLNYKLWGDWHLLTPSFVFVYLWVFRYNVQATRIDRSSHINIFPILQCGWLPDSME